MNYKLNLGFGGLPPITMLIRIDSVVYNQYTIIHDVSPNIAECYRYYVRWGILQVDQTSSFEEKNAYTKKKKLVQYFFF